MRIIGTKIRKTKTSEYTEEEIVGGSLKQAPKGRDALRNQRRHTIDEVDCCLKCRMLELFRRRGIS